MKKIVLIGGISVDYIATADEKLQHHVSNDGHLSMSFGGVSHNICFNLIMLGHKPTFITALHDDETGILIKNHLNQLKVKYYSPKTIYPSCSYVAINNTLHDMDVAIFDNRIVREITPKYLSTCHQIINQADYIILDANVSKESINYVVNKYHKSKKIFCEPISPQLALHFEDVLNKIYLIKCNIHEARSLAKAPKLEKEELVKALFKKGLKNVIISNGKHDIYYGLNNNEIYCFPIKPHTKFKNTTGCGDALFSGVIDQLSKNKNFKKAIDFGHQLSNVVLMCDGAISPNIKKFKNK